MAKVLVISNCQYKPLAAAWKMMRPQDDVEGYEVHTLIGKTEDIAGARRRLSKADIVLHIPIAEDYPVEFARTANIKAASRGTTITVPMLFFEGLHPDIRYIGTPDNRISSPMGDYNSLIVLRRFLRDDSAEAAEKAIFSDEEYASLGHFDRFDASLEELARRDKACDLPAAPILKECLWTVPTLFTVNHPTNLLVKALVIEIFKRLSLHYDEAPAETFPNSLAGGPIWPIPACIVRRHRIAYPPWHAFKTNEGGQRVMDAGEFIRKSFYVYARNLHNIVKAPQAQREIIALGIDPDDCDQWLVRRQDGLSRHGRIWSSRRAGGEPAEPNLQEIVHGTLIEAPESASEIELIEHEIWNHPCDSALLRAYLDEVVRSAAPEEVEAAYLTVIEQAAAPGELFAALIAFQLERHDATRAVQTARAWVSREPASGTAWITLSRLCHGIHHIADALQAAENAVAIDPDNRSYLTILSHRLMDAKQPHLAAAQIRLIRRKFGDNAHDLALLGLACRDIGDLDEAERAFAQAVALEPDYAPFRHGYFSVLMSAGKTTAARQLCDDMMQGSADLAIWGERRDAIDATGL